MGALASLDSATGAIGQPAQSAYTFTAVATTATPIPEGAGTFNSFGPFFGAPVIDGANVAFVGEGSGDQSGVYLFAPPGLVRLADTSTAFPQPDTAAVVSARFDHFDNGSLSIDGVDVAFGARGTITLANNADVTVRGIYVSDEVNTSSGATRQLRIVAQENYSYIPAAIGPSGVVRQVQFPSLDSGAVAFRGVGAVEDFGPGHKGLYLDSPGISLVADTFTLVPNPLVANQRFNGFGPPSANGGHVAFQGAFHTPTLFSIYTTVGGLHAITRTGFGAPDVTGAFSGYLFGLVSNPVLDGPDVAFHATLETSSGVFTDKQGIFSNSGGVLHAIATTGMAIPDRDAMFDTFDVLSFSQGHAAFLAKDMDGESAVYSDLGGTLHRVVGVGDALNGRTIVGLRFDREGLSGDRLAFFAAFSDGSSGVFMATRELLDVTPPVIGAIVTPQPNVEGWFRTAPTVTWSVEDPDSGIATSTDCGATTVTQDTSALTLTCSATNGAGLSASASVTVKVDTIAPVITITQPPDGAAFLLNQSAAAGYACADGLSGIAACIAPVTSGAPLDTATVGARTFTVNAMDAAGNQASLSHHYIVGYAFEGFLAPLNNLPMTNRGPAGRTFPVKWILRDASGAFISDPAAISGVSLLPRACSALGADITGEETSVNAGGLRYDPLTGVWQFNWQTLKSQVGCWSLEVRLTDGNVHAVAFELR